MISNGATNPRKRPTTRIMAPGVLGLVLILLSASSPSIATENSNASIANPCMLYGSVELPRQGSQLFTIDVKANTTNLLGSTLTAAGIAGLAVHPDTMELYALQVNQRGPKATSLMHVDTDTGALVSVGATGLDRGEGLSFRPGDNTLWAWWRDHGLVQIDPATAAYSLVHAGDLPISSLAWDSQGEVLYLAGNRTLWSYRIGDPGFELVQEPLPVSTGGIAMRSDGQLVLTAANTGTSAIDLLVFDPEAGSVVADFGVPALPIESGRSKEGAAAFVRSLAWPLRCGNLSPGGQAELIQSIQIDPPQLCSGDTTLIQAEATHPEGGSNPVLVSIDGLPGAERTMQIEGPPGPRYVYVSASTAEGHVDGDTVELEILECAPDRRFVRLAVGINTYHPYTVDFLVENAIEIAPDGADYTWDFGDGITEVTTVPFISHSYEEELSPDQEHLSFLVSVTVQLPDATSLETSTTVSVWNEYAAGRDEGLIQPLLDYDPDLLSTGTELTGEYRLHNLEDEAILLTQRKVELQPCDSALAADPVPWEPISVLVGPGELLTDSLVLDAASVPEQACGVELHLTGQSGSLQVAADLYFQIKRDPSSIEPVADAPTLAMLNDIAAQGLVADPDDITDEDLYVLANQGLVTIPPLTTTTSTQLPPAMPAQADSDHCDINPIGCPCERGDVEPPVGKPDNVGRLTCQATNEFERYPAHLPNALKGDIILVGGCGLVGEMLAEIDQQYQHTGIMTRNYTEIAHSTSTEDVNNNEDHLNYLPTPHIRWDILQYGWPGIIRSDIGSAFSSLPLTDPYGDTYVMHDFGSAPSGCPGNIVPPLVVKPSPSQAQAVRPLLWEAADRARDLATPTNEWETNGYDGTGNYRFYAYTDAAIARNGDYNWPPGEPATSCSTFVWHVLTQTGEINLEGDGTEPDEVANNWLAGNHDGLYLYPEADRRRAAEFGWNKAFELVMAKSFFDPLFKEIAPAIANQIVNCFISDDCKFWDTYHQNWKNPGDGSTVSPDNILLWDPPTDDDGDGTIDHGVYGHHERMVFRSGGYERVYRWKPSNGTGSVSGVVTYNDRTPAAAATVVLEADGGLETTTDADGSFEILAVSAGEYGIEAQKHTPDGIFLASRDETVRVKQNQVAEIELVLLPPEQDYRMVTVTGSWFHSDFDFAALCLGGTRSFSEGDVENLTCRVDPYCEQPDADGNCIGEFSYWARETGNSTAMLGGSCKQRAYIPGEPADLSLEVYLWGAVVDRDDYGDLDSAVFTLAPGGTADVGLHPENVDFCMGHLYSALDHAIFWLTLVNTVQNY